MHPTIFGHVIPGVRIPAGGVSLTGDLTIPGGARSIVVFAHGSGSSRLSPRNRWVAEQLEEHGFATLLFDLLTPVEEQQDALTGHLRFSIPLLAQRLIAATSWLKNHHETTALNIGYFGASTGAAAALVAAARQPEIIDAVVSRGGRPDLAMEHLRMVRAPTRLIVGARDIHVLALNRAALAKLAVTAKDLRIVPGAGHLFAEPGALGHVADLAGEWFDRHLGTPHGATPWTV